MTRYYFLIFSIFFSILSSQTSFEIEKNIKSSPVLIAEGKKDEFVKLMDQTIQSSSKIGYPYGIACGYYGKAYVANLNRDLSSSINFAKLADQQNIGKEYAKLKTDIYHLLGQNYASLGFSKDALKYYKKMIISSKNILDEKKSVLNENTAYNDIASIYYLDINNTDSAYYYILKVYKSLNDYKDRNEALNSLLAKATTAIGMLNLKVEKKDSADYYLKKSLAQLPSQITETTISPYVYKNWSAIYAIHRKYEKAKLYADFYTKTAEKINVLEDIKDAYELNYKLSEELKDSTAYKNLENYVKVNDSVNKIDKRSISQIFEKDFEEKNNHIEQKSKYLRYLIIIILLILIGLVVGSYFLKQYLQKKNNEKKNILKKKESEIVTLESKINIAFDEVISLAKSNSPIFLTRFKEVYPDFIDKIIEIYPSIQSSELTFCAYIRLNFSTKDIANFIFVTPKTIQMRNGYTNLTSSKS